MREIKFRAWDKLQKKMGEVSFIDFDESIVDIIHAGVLEYDEVAVPDAVLMQYTGLNDVNGNPIYEGDIVRSKRFLSGNRLVGGVEYDKKDASYGFRSQHGHSYGLYQGMINSDEYEVIGNKFENLELLEGME